MYFSEDLKKIMLAGIGAVATTAEKAKEIVDEFVKKGEITVEQGKVLNEELKRNISDTINKYTSCNQDSCKNESIVDKLDSLSDEEIAKIKEKLQQMEK